MIIFYQRVVLASFRQLQQKQQRVPLTSADQQKKGVNFRQSIERVGQFYVLTLQIYYSVARYHKKNNYKGLSIALTISI